MPAAPSAPNSTRSLVFQTGYDSGQAWPAAVCRFVTGDVGSGVYCWTPNDGYTLRLDSGGAYRVRGDEAANRRVVTSGADELSLGETRTANGYSCTSRATGLTCTSPTGHGWSLPRYRGLPQLY